MIQSSYYMATIDLLGWSGAAALAFCALPQFLKTLKTKKADDISLLFVLMWLFGELAMIIYTVLALQSEPKLLANYCLNVIFIAPVLYYKLFPKGE